MQPLGRGSSYVNHEEKPKDDKYSNVKGKPVSEKEKEELKERMKKYVELKFKERELDKK